MSANTWDVSGGGNYGFNSIWVNRNNSISQRQFARSFTIADDVKVNGAELKDGLLTISCERIIPEHKKKKLIEIK